MKALCLAVAAVALFAACDAGPTGPAAPSAPASEVLLPAPPHEAAPCDSVCRSPYMGGGGS